MRGRKRRGPKADTEHGPKDDRRLSFPCDFVERLRRRQAERAIVEAWIDSPYQPCATLDEANNVEAIEAPPADWMPTAAADAGDPMPFAAFGVFGIVAEMIAHSATGTATTNDAHTFGMGDERTTTTEGTR